ncbi:hypothetical protein LCGC14_2061930 [marine sediment metagenome]|uniref:DUF5681 domain-containing protein n=1 Tax=marine sediment metagenome TaxID=412755 RepID=A0A0F9EL15_9ZZZZ
MTRLSAVDFAMAKPSPKTEKKTADKTVGKPFPKGVSGNPKGRPKKGTTWKETITRLTNQARIDETDENKRKVLVKALIVKKQIELALAGDKHATKFLAEREEGMPRQSIDYTEHDPDEVVEIGFKGEAESE